MVCLAGRSVGGRGCTVTRSRGCWRRATRRVISAGRRGRSFTRSRTGSATSSLRIRGSSRSDCASSPARWAMTAGSRSLTTSFGRSARTFQRTIYRPGELVQCDPWEPRELIPVGYGQRRRGWVVTCEARCSRAIVGTLVFSKEAPDILWGLGRNLQRLGGVAGDDGLGPRVGDRRGSPSDRGVRIVLRPVGGRLGDPRAARSAGEVCRRSRSSGSIPTTTRSTRASQVVGVVSLAGRDHRGWRAAGRARAPRPRSRGRTRADDR